MFLIKRGTLLRMRLMIGLLFTISLFAQHSATLNFVPSATGDPATSFNIWRTAGTTCSVLGGAAVPSGAVPFASITASPYVDNTVVAALTYCYTVSAVNSAGQSAMSNSVNAVIPVAAPGAPSLTVTVK
jgi:hypothetical protein